MPAVLLTAFFCAAPFLCELGGATGSLPAAFALPPPLPDDTAGQLGTSRLLAIASSFGSGLSAASRSAIM